MRRRRRDKLEQDRQASLRALAAMQAHKWDHEISGITMFGWASFEVSRTGQSVGISVSTDDGNEHAGMTVGADDFAAMCRLFLTSYQP